MVWNFDKILNDKSPQFDPKQAAQARGRVPTSGRLKAVDDYTVEITTRVGEFAVSLRHVLHLLFESGAVGEAGQGLGEVRPDSRSAPARSRSTAWCRASALELSRFDGYWDKARVPKLDKVMLFPMPEAATRTAALLAGQVDWIEVPAPDAIPRLKQGGMSIVTNKYPHNWAYQPSMVEGSPWTDIRVRKAANLAIDRAGLKKLLGDLMMEGKGAVLSRPSVVRLADFRHQVRSGSGQEAAGRGGLQRHQEAQDQDRDLDRRARARCCRCR